MELLKGLQLKQLDDLTVQLGTSVQEAQQSQFLAQKELIVPWDLQLPLSVVKDTITTKRQKELQEIAFFVKLESFVQQEALTQLIAQLVVTVLSE